jgi:hypothetical protein
VRWSVIYPLRFGDCLGIVTVYLFNHLLEYLLSQVSESVKESSPFLHGANPVPAAAIAVPIQSSALENTAFRFHKMSRSNARLSQIASQVSNSAMASPFSADVVPQAPVDALFGLMAAYKADSSPKKVDLGIGAYRDNDGKPWVLPVVKQVRRPQSVVIPS